MEKKKNQFIAVTYQLYTLNNNKKELVEEATAEVPFQFISGFGITLDHFENQLIDLQQGDEFNIKLTPEQAYGSFKEENIFDLEKEIFTVNGKFDEENIYEGAVVPLQNEEGTRFMARVMDISDASVKVDLNHPLAGKELEFIGKIIENREATNEEIAAMVSQMSGGGCQCGGGCSGGCCHDSNGCGGHC